VRGAVSLIEPLGADTLITVKTETHRMVVRVIGTSPLRLGEHVGLTWNPQDHHVFEGASGRRIT
jgi:multiple sugar transport system ATP-binding protein